ncbi:MAG: hypothetical protein II821_07430 [Treponema sp.]|nr:hypothetical protein [Treponema sp.]
MATTTSIIVLLKFFATRQKNAVVDYRDFCEYLKKYSEHHIEEQPVLSVYLEDPVPALQTELEKLVDTRQIVMTSLHGDKTGILVIPYYIERFSERYKDIAVNPSLPFPNEADLPKGTPKEIVTRENAAEIIGRLLQHQEINDKTLYGLTLPHNAPSILLPSNVSVVTLIEVQ